MQKSTLLAGVLFLSCLLSGCFTQKDYVADYDYNYSGTFKRYKTYAFVDHSEQDMRNLSPLLNETIGARLGSQGFREKPEKPDMLVSYKVFMDSIRYRGYVQPDFDYWLQRQRATLEKDEDEEEDEVEENEKPREKDETYSQIRYRENNGMLVIYVIDSKQGSTIWQGYTAASFDKDSPDFQSDLTRAAYRVMNEFKILNRALE